MRQAVKVEGQCVRRAGPCPGVVARAGEARRRWRCGVEACAGGVSRGCSAGIVVRRGHGSPKVKSACAHSGPN